MEFELDLERIRQLSQEKAEENERFGSFLESHAEGQILDDLVECIHSEVASLVECSECANCSCEPDSEGCRHFPDLDQEGFLSRLPRTLESCAFCPIAYNVYERLKNELWVQRPGSHRIE